MKQIKLLQNITKFQYFNCIGGIGIFAKLNYPVKSFNTSIVSVEFKNQDKHQQVLSCFNTSIVSVEYMKSLLYQQDIYEFQYFNCIGGIF